MNREYLKGQWLELSAAWIKEAQEGRNPTRNGLLDKPMLEACGNVEGLRILDCGCGEGRFCRMIVHEGAGYVLGLDLCEPMIEAARELRSGRDTYRVADVHDLGFIENEAFDLAVSYLNQCDLLDFNANNREVSRVLRPGGKFVVANLHPMRSAVGGWHGTDGREKQHVILDRYFDEGERHWKMKGVGITNFHRSLSTYTRSFLRAGFSPNFSPTYGCNSRYGTAYFVTLPQPPRRIAEDTCAGSSVASLACSTISAVSLRKPVRSPG